MLIADTNFLIYLAKYRLFYSFEEYKKELAVPKQVIRELENLSKNAEKGSDKDAAKTALLILREWKSRILESEGKADNAIISLAKKNSAKVATMDRLLIKELKKAGITILKLRQKKHFTDG